MKSNNSYRKFELVKENILSKTVCLFQQYLKTFSENIFYSKQYSYHASQTFHLDIHILYGVAKEKEIQGVSKSNKIEQFFLYNALS